MAGSSSVLSATAIFAVFVNTRDMDVTTITILMRAGDGQTSVGTLTNPTTASVSLTTDDDPDTWELLEGSLMLPAGTKFLEFQIFAPNADIPLEGVFVDLGRVTLWRCLLTLGVPVPLLGGPAAALMAALLGAAGVVVARRRRAPRGLA